MLDANGQEVIRDSLVRILSKDDSMLQSLVGKTGNVQDLFETEDYSYVTVLLNHGLGGTSPFPFLFSATDIEVV